MEDGSDPFNIDFISALYNVLFAFIMLFRFEFQDKPIWVDQSLFFSVIISQLNQHGWIIPLQHRLHIHSIHYLIQLCNDTLFLETHCHLECNQWLRDRIAYLLMVLQT